MSKIAEGMKEDIIKDSILKLIKGSEAVAMQAVDSAASVMRAGLTNAEDLSVRVNDILLNTARRTINAGNIIGNDVRETTKDMLKGTVHTASEMGGKIKETVSGARAEKPEKQTNKSN